MAIFMILCLFFGVFLAKIKNMFSVSVILVFWQETTEVTEKTCHFMVLCGGKPGRRQFLNNVTGSLEPMHTGRHLLLTFIRRNDVLGQFINVIWNRGITPIQLPGNKNSSKNADRLVSEVIARCGYLMINIMCNFDNWFLLFHLATTTIIQTGLKTEEFYI